MLTFHELKWLLAWPFVPALYARVKNDIQALLRSSEAGRPSVLEVGGRRSPYTIGLRADITILDLPRDRDMQEDLDLGLTSTMVEQLRRQRSNVSTVVLQDITSCTLASDMYHGVMSVEVIEHIPDDRPFVGEIARLLKPGGWAYFTTPNGDYIRNEPPHYNPDHVRHYTKAHLQRLLEEYFNSVTVHYAIKTGKYRVRGLRSASAKHPFRTLNTMLCNVISRIESRGLENRRTRTAHLVAIARKPLA